MGLIRKAIFLATAATGTPLVRWNSSAEAAAKDQRRLMQEQNDLLSQMADSDDEDFDDIPPEWCDENGIPLPAYFEAKEAAIWAEAEAEAEAEAKTAESVDSGNDVQDSKGSSSGTLAVRLREAKSLFEEGLITADEYAAIRKKALGL